MFQLAAEIATTVKRSSRVDIYAHIDPDGITSGSLASLALTRAGIDHSITFLKKLDQEALESIRDRNPELVWFTDFGSGSLHLMDGMHAIITDHHVPTERRVSLEKRRDLLEFSRTWGEVMHLNPHSFGKDGSYDVSGSGCAYLVARCMSNENKDLAGLAVIGAVADQQDQNRRMLVGTNRDILHDAVDAGVVEVGKDIRLFGRETRPVFKLLQYASDPALPRLTGDEEACIVFFLEMGIDLKVDDHWRRWLDLAAFEKRRIVSELVSMLLERGYGHEVAEKLVGEVYLLAKEKEGTPLHDTKEFATLLNACGRYDKAEVGYQICCGDREEYLRQALALLREHRETLVNSLEYVDELGIGSLDHVQFFHAGDKIRDTVVGVTAGMIMSSKDIDPNMPLIAMAESEEGIKVSARGTRELVAKGLDLSLVMREASRLFGGEGGGHNIAAGATIPKGSEADFLRAVDKMVKEQLGE